MPSLPKSKPNSSNRISKTAKKIATRKPKLLSGAGGGVGHIGNKSTAAVLTSLHENSRDAKKLRKAYARDERAKVMARMRKGEEGSWCEF
jgi:hypothetical protein